MVTGANILEGGGESVGKQNAAETIVVPSTAHSTP